MNLSNPLSNLRGDNQVYLKTGKIRLSSMVTWLIVLVPLVGIVKLFTGIRYGPLLFDLSLLLVFAIAMVTNLRKARFDLIDALLLVFLGLAFIQMFNPNVPSLQAGIEGFRKFAFMSIAFYLGRRVLNLHAIVRFQSLLLLVAFGVALYGIKQFVHMSDFEYRFIDLATASRVTYMMGGYLRPFSTLPGPFHLGLYLTVAILWAITSLAYASSPRMNQKLHLGIVIAVTVLAVFFTRTKSTWIGLATASFLLLFLQQRNLLIRLIYASLLAGVVYLGIWVTLTFLPQDSLGVLRDAILAVTNIFDAPTFDIREELWQTEIIPAMISEPILAYGTSSAGEGLSNLYVDPAARYFPSHNLYFKIMLELGLVGLGIFSALVAISVYRGFKTLRRSSRQFDPMITAVTAWSMAVVIAFLVAGFANAVLDAYPANYYFWLLLGILGKGRAHWTGRIL